MKTESQIKEAITCLEDIRRILTWEKHPEEAKIAMACAGALEWAIEKDDKGILLFFQGFLNKWRQTSCGNK